MIDLTMIRHCSDRQFSLCSFLPSYLQDGSNRGERKSIYGKPEHFDELRRKAIESLVKELLSGTSDFKQIVQTAAKLRHEMAHLTETPDAEDWGFPREKLAPLEFLYTTLFDLRYHPTNEKIKALVLKSFPKIRNRDKAIRITKGLSRYTFRLERDQGPDALLKAFTLSDNSRIYEIGFNPMLVEEYKQKMKPMLNRIKNVTVTEEEKVQYTIFPDRNIYIYSGRIEIQSNSEWHPLTRHYAIIGCSDEGEITQENIEDFQKHGFVTLLHTNHRDFEHHNPSLQMLFNQIVNQETSQEERLTAMSEFEYRLQHMSYYKRGGQANGEMIMEALKIAYSPEYKIKGHLEALAEPFLQNYMLV